MKTIIHTILRRGVKINSNSLKKLENVSSKIAYFIITNIFSLNIHKNLKYIDITFLVTLKDHLEPPEVS